MANQKSIIDEMIFARETTYKSDFRWFDIKPELPTVYKPKTSISKETPRLKAVNTLAPLKNDIPFYLLHKPHDILGKNPSCVQRRYDKPVDVDRDSVIKTRPRLVMTPSVSLDDVEDRRARQLLCRDMYLSDMAKGLQEALDANPSRANTIAPLPGLPAPSNPIFLPKLQAPYVSPEWRTETVTWDSKQLRADCEPTKKFWLSQPLPKCRACEETAIINNKRKVECRMKTGLKIQPRIV